jgi:hypothetical protein
MPILGSRAGGAAAGFGFGGGKKGFIEATGGTISVCGDYKVHAFTGPGTFCVSYIEPCTPGVVDYLVVAGAGGTTCSAYPGAAGAGGFRESKQPTAPWTASPLATSTGITVSTSPGGYPVAVGSGGAYDTCTSTPSNPGGTSTFGPINSTGGGGGAHGCSGATTPPFHGQPGGSGSSSGQGNLAPRPGGSGNAGSYSPPEGNPGPGASTAPANIQVTGGGGGATAAGASFGATTGGAGGAGAGTQISPPSYGQVCGVYRYFSGGGGGSGTTGGGAGGVGGGQPGWANPQGPITPLERNGTGNTGGGAGARSNGGSGIVIIKYKYK